MFYLSLIWGLYSISKCENLELENGSKETQDFGCSIKISQN